MTLPVRHNNMVGDYFQKSVEEAVELQTSAVKAMVILKPTRHRHSGGPSHIAPHHQVIKLTLTLHLGDKPLGIHSSFPRRWPFRSRARGRGRGYSQPSTYQ